MKTLAIILVAVLALAGSFGAGMTTGKHMSHVPEQKIPIGFTFNMPCEEHGSHVGKVLDSSLVRIYKLNRDDGEEASFPESDLLDFFNAIGVTVK